MSPPPGTKNVRDGVSLLETVLAVAILAAALAALGHQTYVALRASVRAEAETSAALLCQSRLESLLAGMDVSLPVRNQPVPEAPDWQWSAELLPIADLDGAEWLVVSVHQPGPQAAISRYSLSRLIAREDEREGSK
jgi:hypothetical protein